VVLVAPFHADSGRGNSVSVARIARSLRARGLAIEEFAASAAPDAALERARALRPDLVHCFHAWHSGPAAMFLARALSVPIVVSFRGTDADECLEDPTRRQVVEETVAAAAVLVTLSEAQRERVLAHFPGRESTTLVVQQGVAPRPGGRDFRVELRIPPGAPLIVQAAGLRWIKGIPRGLEVVDRAKAAIPELCYALAGQPLEEIVAAEVVSWMRKRPWAGYLGELEHSDATALIAGASVLLNSSEREGSSNAILEAMALGVPVVASDIPPNRETIEHAATGMLFRTADEGAAAIAAILGDRRMATRLARAAAAAARDRFSPEREARGYVAAYELALHGVQG
jgi:glycosyltransferase involved in cell wall biosynthesis